MSSVSNRCRGARSCAARGHAGAAAAGCHVARVLAPRQEGRQARASLPGVFYVPNGMALEYWTPKAKARRSSSSPILDSARGVPEPDARVSGLHAFWTPVARRRLGDVSDRQPREARSETRPRPTSRSTRSGAASSASRHSWPPSSSPIDGTGQCRGVHRQSQLRLHQHDFVAHPNDAAADGDTIRGPCSSGLFGDSGSTDPAARARTLRAATASLDSVNDKLADLKREIGAEDRLKMDEYTEAVRDVERRIHKAEEQNHVELPLLEQPQGVPASFEEHLKLMFDLQLLALPDRPDAGHHLHDRTRAERPHLSANRRTRCAPSALAPRERPGQDRADGEDQRATREAVLRTTWQKLRETPDGDGSLLDHMTILYGSGMSNSTAHAGDNVPVRAARRRGGRLKGGRHLNIPATPRWRTCS